MVVNHVDEIVVVRVASDDEDAKEATDYVIDIAPGTIACRVRRSEYEDRFRDLTIRWSRPSEAITEAAKIQAGWARWYLYCWESGGGELNDWIWVDLDHLRKSWWLVTSAPEFPNKDGSSTFKAIPWLTLLRKGQLLDHHISESFWPEF